MAAKDNPVPRGIFLPDFLLLSTNNKSEAEEPISKIGPKENNPKILPHPANKRKSPPPIPCSFFNQWNTALISHKEPYPMIMPKSDSSNEVK